MDPKLIQIWQGDIRTIASSPSNLFLGTGDGLVQILSSSFKLIRSWPAYDAESSVSHLQQVQGTSLLVTLGEDLSSEPVLKVWALDQIEKKTGAPKCLSTLTVQNGRKRFPVSALVTAQELSGDMLSVPCLGDCHGDSESDTQPNCCCICEWKSSTHQGQPNP